MRSPPDVAARAATPSDPTRAPPHDDTVARLRNRITLAALAATVALATGVTNLVYDLWPDLRKDPGLQRSASIAVLTMDRNVDYGDYRKRPGSNADPNQPANDTSGNVFYLQVKTEGFKGRRAKLRWFTYDANRRLPRPFSTGHDFRSRAPTAAAISQEWVPLPPAAGDYHIRFELYDSGDVLLAFADSKTFTTKSVGP